MSISYIIKLIIFKMIITINTVLLTLTLLIPVFSRNGCIGIQGKQVSWWVVLIFPKNIPDEYAYIDSNSVKSSFIIRPQQADTYQTPFYKTIMQINDLSMQYIIWNDQLPNGTTTSSKAHAKGLLAFDINNQSGFYFGHSIPMFPNVIEEIVSPIIGSSQRVYGQHAFCLSLKGFVIRQMIEKIIPMRPYIYSKRLDANSTFILNQFRYKTIFGFQDYTIDGTKMKFIFKNGGNNGSIFEDGLNLMLNSPLMVQSWGRPLQAPWCQHQLSVGNIREIKFTNNIYWNQSKDHGKWGYALQNNYACFGDLNRMTSQWRRGGAFFCIQSQYLKQALVRITSQTDTCTYKTKYQQIKTVILSIFFLVALYIL